MTVDELCQRVHAGRAELMKEAMPLIFMSRIAVVLNPQDCEDVVLEAQKTWRPGVALPYRAEAPPWILGFSVHTDPTLEPGEVRFRAEVPL